MDAETIVIGAGAAGLACASQLKTPCLVLEKNARPGLKILISGGGRCNFTNTDVSPGQYVGENVHFSRSALARWTAEDTLGWVNDAGIAWHEKHRGQLFCDHTSKDILDLLLADCNRAGVEIRCGTGVQGVSQDGDKLVIRTSKGELNCHQLVVASGGLSVPRLGVSDVGYRIAKHFGHRVVATVPSLVGLRWPAGSVLTNLAGMALPVRIKYGGQTFDEDLLFTHTGVSGPAILQISNYWNPGAEIEIDVSPSGSIREKLAASELRDKALKTALATVIPKALAIFLGDVTGLGSRKVKQLQEPHLIQIDEAIHRWHIVFNESEGWKKAEVTRGGVDTAEVSSKTFESSKQSGLYFVGEVLDVTGWLGGYNFQWAFASGRAAAEAINSI